MTSQQADLYAQIRGLQFGSGDSTHTFEDRLMRENAWTRAFARRAIEEYRRFLMLAATAGHPVSPSDAVDQVWHLHLLYTRSYWDELCRRILPRPLHHEPSTGGEQERAKFETWYANTIDRYRWTFGQEPPADIWPDPAAMRHVHHQRIDPTQNWVLPKRNIKQVVVGLLLLVLLLALASGCAPLNASNANASITSLNPFDLRGPLFLVFYVVAFIVAIVLASMIRAAARGDGSGVEPRDLRLDPYEIAYLRGGPNEAVKVAVTQLMSRGLLRLNPSDGTLRSAGQTVPATNRHAIESAVYRAVSPTLGTRMTQVCSAARREGEAIAERLRERELLVSEVAGAGAATLATLVALSVPAVGAIKIIVGIGRDKPVGFLVIACFLSAMLALALFARRPHRTRRGDAVLRRLTTDHTNLRRPRNRVRPDAEPAMDLPLAVALFGAGALADTELSALQKTLRQGGSDAGGSSWNSALSCGSSCGSSCSGGGCGGGGCGGCGGS